MKLKEILNTVINVKTQKECDELMRIYEEAGWKWSFGKKPTNTNFWNVCKNKTCIKARNGFKFLRYVIAEELGYKIITLTKFKKLQEIKRGKPKKVKKETKKKRKTIIEIGRAHV